MATTWSDTVTANSEPPATDETHERDVDWAELKRAALQAAETAYAPYSKLSVGAAGLTTEGLLVSGCNVENASYGLTLCAECGLVSDLRRHGGGAQLTAMAVVGLDGEPLAPCGRCRQLLLEAGGPGLLVWQSGGPVTIAELLPGAFTQGDLPDEPLGP